MLENFIFYLGIVVLIVLLVLLSRRIRVAYPVILVISGLGISFIPGLPVINIDPELIFIIFLPPLLYQAAWSISWKELWRWRRIISSFAFLVVFFTAFSVALVSDLFIPGFTLALGFLLGGIVSPPDAVSTGSIIGFIKVPRRVVSILEGESLLNDASALIIFQFALIAILKNQFVWYQAVGSFVWMVLGGAGIGLMIANIFLVVHKRLPTDPNIDIVLSIVAPYIMYIVADMLNSSGVLAVVSGGLWLSNNRLRFLSSASRIRGVNVWESLSFVLNGLVFMFIGLGLPQIISGLGEVRVSTAIRYGVFITIVLIVLRIVASYAALIITLIARNFIKVADPRNPGWKAPLIIGWAGMRGVVSLAAALSIPVSLSDGTDFPQRNLILFIAFVVILLTLVVQGLTLPFIIKKVRLADPDFVKADEEIYRELKDQSALAALQYLKNKYKHEADQNPVILNALRMCEKKMNIEEEFFITDQYQDIYLEALDYQRQWLIEKNKSVELLNEEIVRENIRRLDLEEERLRMRIK